MISFKSTRHSLSTYYAHTACILLSRETKHREREKCAEKHQGGNTTTTIREVAMSSAQTSVADNSPPLLARVLNWTSGKFDVHDLYPRYISPKRAAVGQPLPPSDCAVPTSPPSSAGQATTQSTSGTDNGDFPTVAQQHDFPKVRAVQPAALPLPMVKTEEATLPAYKEEIVVTAPSKQHVQNARRRKRSTRQEVPPPPPQQQQQPQQHVPSLLENEANDDAALCMARVKGAEKRVFHKYEVALKLSGAVNVLEEKKELAVAQAGPLEAEAHIAFCKLKLAQAGASAAKARHESYSRSGRVIRSWMEKWDMGPRVDVDAATRRVEEATQVHTQARVKSELAWDQVHHFVMELNAASMRLSEAQGSFDRAVGMLLFLEEKADCAAKKAAATARTAEVTRLYWERNYKACGRGRKTESQPAASRTGGPVQDGVTCYEQVERRTTKRARN